MGKNNGRTIAIIGIIVAALVTLSIAALPRLLARGERDKQIDINKEDIVEMKPKVEKNTEHRIQFEEKVSTMEKNIREILVEVKK
jgi:septal ring factor EnvC (AmiA/AmiB activator)